MPSELSLATESHFQKQLTAEDELRRAVDEYVLGRPSWRPGDAGNVQCWLDVVEALRNGEDVSVFEPGRGRVI